MTGYAFWNHRTRAGLLFALLLAFAACGADSESENSVERVADLPIPSTITDSDVLAVVIPDSCPSETELESCRDQIYEGLQYQTRFIAVNPGSTDSPLTLWAPPDLAISREKVVGFIDSEGNAHRAWVKSDGTLIAVQVNRGVRLQRMIIDDRSCDIDFEGIVNSVFTCT